MMSSNVIVQNDASTQENCQIYIAQNITDKISTVGRLNLDNVMLDGCGKTGFGNGAVSAENVQNTNAFASTITNSKFINSGSAGVYLNNTQNIVVDSNLFLNNTNNSIIITDLTTVPIAKPIQITNNYIVSTLESTSITTTSISSGILIQNLASFTYNANNLQVSGNVVSSGLGAAYISPAMACSGTLTNSLNFINNTAHSGSYGWIVTGYGSPCLTINGFVAYMMQEGLVTSGFYTSQSNGAIITAQNLLMTDNKVSVTLNGGFSGNQT